MATITAPTHPSEAPEPGLADDPVRQVWQVPVFVTGVAALAAVLVFRPLAHDNPRRALERDLNAARHLLNRPDGDAAEALARARHALDASESFPDRAGEALLLIGSATVRLAEQAGPAQAPGLWTVARDALEEAERRGVPEAEQGRLQYRLGQVGFHTRDDPRRVVARLAGTVEQAEDRAEGFNLLTLAYLRLDPPDRPRALEANERLRQVPLVGEEVLAPARLQGGELLLEMHRTQEARRVLAKIGAGAPPRILARARVLRGRILEDEGKGAEAAALYQEALADTRAPLEDRAPVLYHLGVCYRQAEQVREAAAVWQECLGVAKGEEGPAAALALAELRLPGKDREGVVDLLGRAVEGVRTPAQWRNTLIDVKRACGLFEQADQALRQAKRFDLAVRLAGLYERLAVPGRAQVLRGTAAAEWAQARREQGQQGKDEAVRQTEEKAARALLVQAATAAEEAARRVEAPAEKAEHLHHAAKHYRAAGEHLRAADTLGAYLKLVEAPERRGEGLYQLGEAWRQAGKTGEAAEAYRACIQAYGDTFPTPFAYRARYQLALFAIEAGNLDEADAALTLNLKLLRFDSDREAQEKSLFALGDLYYHRHNYRMVVRRLEEALGMAFRRIDEEGSKAPPNPEAIRARYQLADSYQKLAAQEILNQRLSGNQTVEASNHFQQEHMRWLRKAASEFESLDTQLQKPGHHGHLSDVQESQAPLIAARCWFNAGEYNRALKIYESLLTRYGNRPERIDALGGTVSCYSALGDKKKVAARLDEIREALPSISNPAVRKSLEEWLKTASKVVVER